MNQKTLTPIGLAAVVATLATAATILFAADPKDKSEGKFHLVYLVSTDKVEVGAKAYVEPLFFTDGKRLVFAYDYCRQYYQRSQKKPEMAYPGILIRKEDLIYPNQIATNLAAIHSYCNGKETRLDFSKFIVRDSTGLRLTLSNVSFLPQTAFDDMSPGMVIAPIFPERGTSEIQSVEGRPFFVPEATIEGGQQYFFLASDNAAILDLISPVLKIREHEVAALKKRIRDYAQERLSAPKNGEMFKGCKLGHPRAQVRKGPYRLEHVRQYVMAFADLDSDGRADAIVALQETVEEVRPAPSSPDQQSVVRFNTTEIRLLYGNGQSICYLWLPGVPRGIAPSRVPLAVIWLGKKGYLVVATGDGILGSESFNALSVVPSNATATDFPGAGFKYHVPIK